MLLTGARAHSRASGCAITVHLVDSATASYLWSESIDAASADPSPRRSAVADAVRQEARAPPGRRRRSGGTRRPAENLAARNLYLQGRYHLNQRTDEGLQKALEFFEKAIVEDAHFALAHSGLADAHSLLAHYGVARSRRGVDAGRRRARRRR